ncbi:hypothetical protein TNIN_151751 [Trichonephila inaurata madagascariensis]|uniref:Uncharacterized protein n=1 Tax=Trichonephila inaurata madagascariensis TaxID=2747483 RepID=A0A8X6WTM5_9ARAC|nr:hypothetical protein TNIN_151751 [Trichonephila inaurata madagascariensis]
MLARAGGIFGYWKDEAIDASTPESLNNILSKGFDLLHCNAAHPPVQRFAFDWTATEEITAATIPDIPLDRTYMRSLRSLSYWSLPDE